MVLGRENRDNSNSNHKDKGHEQHWSLRWEAIPSPLDALSDLISPLPSHCPSDASSPASVLLTVCQGVQALPSEWWVTENKVFSRHSHVGSHTVPSASRDKGKPYKDKVSGTLERNFWATWLHVAFPITIQGKEAHCRIKSVSPSSLQPPPGLKLRGIGQPPEMQVFISPHFPNICFIHEDLSSALQSHWQTGPPKYGLGHSNFQVFFFLIFFRAIHAITGCLRLPPRTFTCG